MKAIRLAIHGAAGRMGNRLVALASADSELAVVGALESSGHRELGRDAGILAGVGPIGVPFSTTLGVDADCLVDFSVPDALPDVLQLCRQLQLPLILATTGLTDRHKQDVAQLAREVPVVWSPSMSLAVNLTMKLATIAAEACGTVPAAPMWRSSSVIIVSSRMPPAARHCTLAS